MGIGICGAQPAGCGAHPIGICGAQAAPMHPTGGGIGAHPGAGIHGSTGAQAGAGAQSAGGGAPTGGHSSHVGFGGGGGGRAGGAGAAGAGAIPKNSWLEYLVQFSCFFIVNFSEIEKTPFGNLYWFHKKVLVY